MKRILSLKRKNQDYHTPTILNLRRKLARNDRGYYIPTILNPRRNESYAQNPEPQKEANKKRSRVSYTNNPEPQKKRSRVLYAHNPEPQKKRARVLYALNPEPQKKRARVLYALNPEPQKKKSRVLYAVNPIPKQLYTRSYYFQNHKTISAVRKARYTLTVKDSEPDFAVTFKNMYTSLEQDKTVSMCLVQTYAKLYPELTKDITTRGLRRAATRIAARRLINKAKQLRAENVKRLLKCIRKIMHIQLDKLEDFGEPHHTIHSEPFFYDASYCLVSKQHVIPVNENGKCVIAEPYVTKEDKQQQKDDKSNNKWKCTKECKNVSQSEVDTIINLRKAFNQNIHQLRDVLQTCNECSNGHYTKPLNVDFTKLDFDIPISCTLDHIISCKLKGHPLVCHNEEGGCNSSLRVVGSVSTHYPVVRAFLGHLSSAVKAHFIIYHIDSALNSFDVKSLMTTCRVYRYDTLLKIKNSLDDASNSLSEPKPVIHDSAFRNPMLETILYHTYELMIDEFEKDIGDYPEIPCCSCERLSKRSQVTKVSLEENLGTTVWPILQEYILQHDPNAIQHFLYMCNYCKPMIKKEKLPARCILNGLESIPVPNELKKLDPLSIQLVQRAKCYQTIIRLGTYTAKVPTYNSLKACKGNMFFLPLPMSKTLETLSEVKETLPNPELYVILNGQPTDSKLVWRSLLNIRLVKAAVHKLKEINWLYKDVDPDSVDDATKNVIEVVNNTTSKMLEKATKEDIAGFQSYTIRNMYTKLSTESDIEQFKLLKVKEHPLDNRQKYLDVMCFPTLFPNGQFGEYHNREVKLTSSEFAKSRLLNKDSRYRKNPQYVFYLLWQKELRDLSAGIYSFLKSTKSQPMAVGLLINKVNACDKMLEGNLSTVLQTIRGSKQYWFTRQNA